MACVKAKTLIDAFCQSKNDLLAWPSLTNWVLLVEGKLLGFQWLACDGYLFFLEGTITCARIGFRSIILPFIL
jgi:hypothetical protein